MDRGYTITDSNKAAEDKKAISSSAGTSTVGIKVTEDLGGGLKAGLSINTDFADAGSLTQDTSGTTPTASATFANSQSFMFIEDAKLGKVQLGNINNEILTALTGVGAPSFSTGVGSSYSSSWSVLNGYGNGKTDKQNQVHLTTNDNETAGARGIRQANTVKYVSPNFSGVTVAYGQALKVDQASGANNTVGVTDMSLTYANGPLTVMYASLKFNVGANDVTANGSLTAGTTNTHAAWAASYAVMPTLKFHAAIGSSKSSNGTIADSTFNQYGVTYTVGQFDIMAQTAKVDDKLTANIDRKMTGLGVNYNLSKRTRVYARYDSLDRDTAHAHDSAKNTELKRTAVGISHSF